jgi:galactonate dehydratase
MEPPIIFAITGVENALYDILGKSLGVPVYRLLGGRYRDSIPLYADCHAGAIDEPSAYADKARAVVEEGFTALKYDADAMGRDNRQDSYSRTVRAAQMTQIIDTLSAVRDAIGFDVDLGVDCHGRFDMPSAVTLAGAVDGLRLMWIEEPLPAHNVEALAQVRAKTRTPICTGENHYTLTQFRDLLQRGAADILMPDLAKAGGITEAMRIADLAETYYVPLAPHNVSSPLGMAAACHVLASIPNFLVLEFHARDITWWDDLCKGGPFVVDGAMAVPEAPGLGVELDDDVARELLWNGDEYFSPV